MSFPYNNNNNNAYQYRDQPFYRHTDRHQRYNRGRFEYGKCILICICSFWFIFTGVFLIIGENSVLPQTNSDYIIITPQETYLLNTKNAIFIDVTAENEIESSFFNEEPSLTDAITYHKNESFLLNSEYYKYLDFYMKTGSQLVLNFESSLAHRLNFYIIKGDSEFSKFENPNYDYNSEEDKYVTSLSHITFTSEESDYYYLVWENLGFTRTINYTLDMKFTEYDVSNPQAWKFGRFTQENSFYPYVVIKNTDNSSNHAVSFRVDFPSSNQNPTPKVGKAGLFALVGIVLIFSFKSPTNSKNYLEETTNDINPPQYRASTPHTSDCQSMDSYPSVDIPKNVDSMRSIPISCNLCGAHLDENSLKFLISNEYMFCSGCGTKITK